MIKSINPYNQEIVHEVTEFDKKDVENAIDKADAQYKIWKEIPFSERAVLMKAVGQELKKIPERMARLSLKKWENQSLSQ